MTPNHGYDMPGARYYGEFKGGIADGLKSDRPILAAPVPKIVWLWYSRCTQPDAPGHEGCDGSLQLSTDWTKDAQRYRLIALEEGDGQARDPLATYIKGELEDDALEMTAQIAGEVADADRVLAGVGGHPVREVA